MNPNTYNVHLPVDNDFVDKLKAGDIVYLNGIIMTGRDLVHKRIIDYNKSKKSLPDQFKCIEGGAIFHMGPIVKEIGENRYKIISGGPTTSARMNPFQTEVNSILKNKFVIGKGGMKNINWGISPCLYLQYPGGVGALTSKFIENVVDVEWKELGPEAAWFLEVKNFGPLLVAIDLYGGDLFSHH